MHWDPLLGMKGAGSDKPDAWRDSLHPKASIRTYAPNPQAYSLFQNGLLGSGFT